MTKILTVRDAMMADAMRDAAQYSESIVARNAVEMERAILTANPEIGIAMTAKGKRFYAYVGANRFYVESASLEAVANAVTQSRSEG
jgi:hypothetical protein